MSRPKRANRTYLDDLGVHDAVHSQIEGRLTFRNLFKKTDQRILSLHAHFVIAANQACCELGCGQVFQVFRAPSQFEHNALNFEAYKALKSLPPLVYLPKRWTQTEQQAWRLMRPLEQMHRSWAPHGWLHTSMAVLPFQLVVPEHSKPMKQAKFFGLVRYPVMFFVTPECYGGTSEEIMGLCQQYQTIDQEHHVSECHFKSNQQDWSAFAHLKLNGLDGIITRLEEWTTQETRFLVAYGCLLETVNRAYQTRTETLSRVGDDSVETAEVEDEGAFEDKE